MLIDYTLRFYPDELIWLDADAYHEFIETGSISQQLEITGYEEENKVLVLAFDESRSDYFFTIEPEEDLDAFVHYGRLSYWLPAENRLAIADKRPLREVLIEGLRRPEGPEITTHLKPRRLKRWLKTGDIVGGALAAIKEKGFFYGEIALCPQCGNFGCPSSYIWIENNVCLLLIKVDAMIIDVQIFPFVLKFK